MDATKPVRSPSPKKQSPLPPGTVKLFVGGLTGEMTKETLAEYFSDYTEIVDSFVVHENQKPAGFGFITVKDKRAADKILQATHTLNSSILDVKPALDRAQAKDKEESDRRRKIFVGGLPKNFPDSALKEFFDQFGPVQKCYVVKDTITGKTRGFGFVIFSTDEGYLKSLENPNLIIGGNEAHVKAATTKPDTKASKDSVTENTTSPKTKRSKRSKNQHGEKSNDSNQFHFVPQRPQDYSPPIYNQAQFHPSSSQFDDYYYQNQPQWAGEGFYNDWPRHPPMPLYPSQASPQRPMPGYHHAQHSQAEWFSPGLGHASPIHPSSFYGPGFGSPMPAGHGVHLYPVPGRQTYCSQPLVQPHQKSMFTKPHAAKLNSTQAMPFRPQAHNYGSSTIHYNRPAYGQPAKSAHVIGVQPRQFSQTDQVRQGVPLKYTQNPFGHHEDEEEEENKYGLEKAGDF